MQFSDTSTSQGLLQDARFLVQADANAFPTADVVRSVNHWYYKVFTWIMDSQSLWNWDDSNQTDFPVATSTLVDNQHDYSFPASLNKVNGVAVADGDGDFHYLKRLDRTERSQPLDEQYDTKGFPAFYDLVGNSVLIYPAPSASSVTLAAGLKIYFDRDFDEFTAADTTQEPGFKPESCHRILSYGAALDYALARGYEAKVLNNFQDVIEALRRDLVSFQAARDVERGPKIRITRRRPI